MVLGDNWSVMTRKLTRDQPGNDSTRQLTQTPVCLVNAQINSMHIRTFRFPDDYAAVHDLWQNAGPGIHVRRSDEPQEIYKKIQRDPDLFLVAEEDHRIIGTVVGGYDGRRGMVYHLAISASYRRRGTGSSLMEALEKRLQEKGCTRYYLLVTRDNTNAMQFYESHGWQRMDDLHVYSKDLV